MDTKKESQLWICVTATGFAQAINISYRVVVIDPMHFFLSHKSFKSSIWPCNEQLRFIQPCDVIETTLRDSRKNIQKRSFNYRFPVSSLNKVSRLLAFS